jgi:hypothetical protein
MTYIQENRAKHILYPCPQPKGDENREAMPQTSLDQKSHASTATRWCATTFAQTIAVHQQHRKMATSLHLRLHTTTMLRAKALAPNQMPFEEAIPMERRVSDVDRYTFSSTSPCRATILSSPLLSSQAAKVYWQSDGSMAAGGRRGHCAFTMVIRQKWQ